MIHDVKVFDKHGKLIKTIPGKKVSEDYWKRFNSKRSPHRVSLKPVTQRNEPEKEPQ